MAHGAEGKNEEAGRLGSFEGVNEKRSKLKAQVSKGSHDNKINRPMN
jgi:hypothetical protein